jgi:glycosyltransferase involved in cell wall biosynthesis
LRIAQVVSSYDPQIGGVETHVRRLAQGCAEAGDQVEVLTYKVDGAPVEEWIEGVHVRRFALTVNFGVYKLSLGLFDYLTCHRTDFDVVHAHSYHTLAGHAARGAQLPFVFTPHYHGTGHTPFRTFWHKVYRPAGALLFEAADSVICVSDAERELVTRDFPGAAGKVQTIPNGTEAGEIGRLDQFRSDSPVLLTIGRLERYKNVDLIIDAFRRLPSSAMLFVVGDGPDRARLERRARASEPGWPVVFTGIISDSMLASLLARASVVTSASDHEAFGMTLADGLASGARIVASDIPAHAELARLAGDCATVTLVDARDSKRFTNSLAVSLVAGRSRTEDVKLPSWGEAVANTRELYAQVSSKGHLADRRAAV